MKKNKLILISFLGLVGAAFISIPIQTELDVRKAKKIILNATQIETLEAEFGELILIESEKKRETYISQTKLEIQEDQDLWMIGREGIPYWMIYIITDHSGRIIDGHVDRLW
jgi:hypothetical protein